MDFLIYIVGAAVMLWIIVAGIRLKVMLGARFRCPTIRVVSGRQIPEVLRRHLNDSARELFALGFRQSHFQSAQDADARLTTPRWCAVLKHETEQSYAIIGNWFYPDEVTPMRVDFVTLYDDGSHLTTVNGVRHLMIDPPPPDEVHDAVAETVDAQWAHHLEMLAAREAGSPSPLHRRLVTPARFVELEEAAEQRYLDHLARLGLTTETPAGTRLRFASALKLSRIVNRNVGAEQKRKAQVLTTRKQQGLPLRELTGLEVMAFQAIDDALKVNTFSGIAKTLMFLGSALVFALAFGMVWSWLIVPMLLGVLLFHELGHLLAMKLFGYRDLQILFIPLLGAVASGDREDTAAWQRTIILLAGPVPGLIVAGLMMLWTPENVGEWWTQLIAILVVLNLFNLLPLMPLDGGQIVNTLLFDRHPRLQMGFVVLSVAGFGIAAWLLTDPLLTVLAIIMALSLLGQYRQAGLMRRILAAGKPTQSREAILASVFSAMRDEKYRTWPFIQRYQVARGLVSRLEHRAARWWESVLGLTAYAGAIAAPALIVFMGIWSAVAYEERDWDAELAAATVPEQRLDLLVEAGYWHLGYEDADTSLRYFRQGALEAEQAGIRSERYAQALTGAIEAQLDAWDGEDARRDWERALSDLHRLEDAFGEEHAAVGNALISLGDFASAFEELEANAQPTLQRAHRILASHEDPSASRALRTLAHVEERAGNLSLAEAHFEQLSREDDEYGSGLDDLAEFYVRQDRLEPACATFARAVDLVESDDDQAMSLIQPVWCALLTDDLERAEALLARHRQAIAREYEEIADETGLLGTLAGIDETLQWSMFRESDEAYLVLHARLGNWPAAREQVERLSREFDPEIYSFDDYLQAQRDMVSSGEKSFYLLKARAIVESVDLAGGASAQDL